MRITRPEYSQKILVEETVIEHNHIPQIPLEGDRLLTDQTKEFISQQFKDGRSPALIRNKLQEVYFR